MTTVSDVIESTLRQLHSGQREEINKLASDITDVATSLTLVHDIGGIQSGADIEIGTEICYVWNSESTTLAVAIQRGMRGSTAVTHSSGDLISVNPKFPRFSVLQAINDELASLSSPENGLYQVPTPIDLTYSPSTVGYDLSGITDMIGDPISVRYSRPGLTGDWPLLNGWSVSRGMDTTDFASGFALFTTEGGYPSSTIRVQYRAKFSPVSSLSQNLNTVSGLHAEATDIVALGAAIRLMAPREIKRNFTEAQGDSRRSDEVPAGSTLQSYRGLLQLHQDRIKEEATRLAQRYPQRRWV